MQPTLEQQNIIHHTSGHALVFAVAGSGKTTTMIERILHLIRHKQVRPERILACTYSREAAATITQRLARYPEAAGVTALTIHALAYRVVMEAGRLHLTDLRIGEEHFSSRLFAQARAALIAQDEYRRSEYFNIKFDDFNTYMSVQKGNLRLPTFPQALPVAAQKLIKPPATHPELYAALYTKHDELRLEQRVMDYDDCLVEAWMLLSQYPQLQRQIASKWDYVHVDEFQDVNLAQSELLDLIASGCTSYTAIGDDDQTIYQWRGAHPRYILKFAQRYNATKFPLTTNFRCPMGVVALADKVIERNTVREPKRLQASRLGQGVYLHRQRAGAAAHIALEQLAAGVAPHDIAILIRTYAQTGEIEQVLLEQGTPYLIVGSQPFYQRHEVKVLLAYLRLALADLDVQRGLTLERGRREALLQDWELVANQPNRYIRKQVVQDLGRTFWQGGRTLIDVLTDYSSDQTQQGSRNIAQFYVAFSDLVGGIGLAEGKDTLLEFTQAIGYTQHLIDTAPTREFGEERAGSVRALAEMAKSRSLGELMLYLTGLAQQARHEEKLVRDEQIPRITIMTAFRAKGLEFPVVIVPDCKASLYKLADREDMAASEEERRIFYVALTRAKQELHLIVDPAEPTSFLTDASYVRLVQAHTELNALLALNPVTLSARKTFELSELLQVYHHEAFIQRWFDKEKRQRLLKRFDALKEKLVRADAFVGQQETIKQLSLDNYAKYGPLELSDDPALSEFSGLTELLQAQTARYQPKETVPSAKPGAARFPSFTDSLHRQTRVAGNALGPEQMRVGMQVQHKNFGLGTVKSLKGSGNATEAEVEFVGKGTKRLMVAFANLTAVSE